MPDSMRFDNNGQPMGYGDPMDPYGQYAQQGAYPGAMPSPQDIYSQQQYAADPNQMYMDPNQGMYGAQPVQDPYGQYAQQPYMDPNAGMGAMPGAYPEIDPMMGAQQSYMDQDPQFQQMQGYGQPQQQAYPGMQQTQPFGQQPQQPQQSQQPQQQMPQPMAQQPQQQMPQPMAQPQPEPAAMDPKAAKKQRSQQAPANLGPEPPASKATLCMILGILSVVFALIPPVGIILAIVVRKMSGAYTAQGGSSPKAETGRIFATVGLIFGFIMLAVLVFMIIFIYAGLFGEGQARSWAVFFNNSPFGNIWRIPIPNPLG